MTRLGFKLRLLSESERRPDVQEVRDTTSHRLLAREGRLRGTEMERLRDTLPSCRREVEVASSLWTPRRPGDMPIQSHFVFHWQPQGYPLGEKKIRKW